VNFEHTTVMLEQAVDAVVTDLDGVYVDCTMGGGGHSRRILQALSPNGRLICFDQDPLAIRYAEQTFARDPRVTLVNRNFQELESTLHELGIQEVRGVLFDLGVSSPQLDEAARGFSYMLDAPLDMRMNPNQELTARTIINTWGEEQLARIIWEYGEERFARRIARAIVAARAERPIGTTGELVEIIKRAMPAGAARKERQHPAKRTFQALRIAVNDELGALERTLDQVIEVLSPGGRVAVITFHSLEDRIVKDKMKSWLGRCTCPPGLPVCRCGNQPLARILTRKPVLPSADEVEHNPRARSAKLRVAEKL